MNMWIWYSLVYVSICYILAYWFYTRKIDDDKMDNESIVMFTVAIILSPIAVHIAVIFCLVLALGHFIEYNRKKVMKNRKPTLEDKVKDNVIRNVSHVLQEGFEQGVENHLRTIRNNGGVLSTERQLMR